MSSARFLASPNSQFLNTQSTAYAAAPLLPNQVTTATNVLWLEADFGVTLNAGNVSDWADQSPLGTNAVQATPAAQPYYGTVGGKPAITTDANRFLTILMNTNHRMGVAVRTYIFTVYRTSDNNTGRSVIGRFDTQSEWAVNPVGAAASNQGFFVGLTQLARAATPANNNIDHIQYAYYLNNANPGVQILGLDSSVWVSGTANAPTNGVNPTYIGRSSPSAAGSIVADIRAIYIFRNSTAYMSKSDQDGLMSYIGLKWGTP